jgi:hypothetical protein
VKSMYTLKFNELKLLDFNITSGDAPMGCVLAVITTGAETKLLENHIKEFGAEAETGINELALSEPHSVLDGEDRNLNYSGGVICWVEELEEITLELVGIPYPEYEFKFPHLVSQYNELHKST